METTTMTRKELYVLVWSAAISKILERFTCQMMDSRLGNFFKVVVSNFYY